MIEVLNSNLRKVDILRKYTFSQYEDCFRDIGTFTINARLVEENNYLLDRTEQYYILFNKKMFGVVESIEKDSDSEYEKTIVIKGKMANVLFTKRVVKGTLVFSGNNAQYIRELIYQNITKDANSNRYVNIDIIYNDEQYLNSVCSKVDKQVTGDYVWDEIQTALEQDSLGLEFVPKVDTKHTVNGKETNISEWELYIKAGVDRRKGNKQGNKPIIFSQSLSNIERTTYNADSSKYTNVAYVAGEGEEQNRKWYEIDINNDIERVDKKGWNRSELWIDARDIQSEDSGGKLSDLEYEKLIRQRANEKASENNFEESYDATITETSKVKYKIGIDYNIGDFVTIIDKELNIVVDAQVTKNTVSEQDNRTVTDITFTYGKVVRDKIRQIGEANKKIENNKSNIKYLENKIAVIDKNKASYGSKELLWSGTLAKGKDVNLGSSNWKKYNLFMARTSDGVTMMIGTRNVSETGDNPIRFVGAYDDGSNSYVFKANTIITQGNKFKNVACSLHKYITSSSGSGMSKALDLKELWGII